MQIGNRLSQCFHTLGTGAPVYPCGFICQTWWVFFQRESMKGFVKCFCGTDLKWNGFLKVVSGIALMLDMLLCCVLLYVGYKSCTRSSSVFISHIWTGVCCVWRWHHCIYSDSLQAHYETCDVDFVNRWSLSWQLDAKLFIRMRDCCKSRTSNPMTEAVTIWTETHEHIWFSDCCLNSRLLCFCVFGTFSLCVENKKGGGGKITNDNNMAGR